jgi:hypothetical protein
MFEWFAFCRPRLIALSAGSLFFSPKNCSSLVLPSAAMLAWMIHEPLSMAPDLIFDQIRGAIEAGIGLVRLCVCLQRRAGHQVQGAIGPESRSFWFNRYMAGGLSSPIFRQGGVDSRRDVGAKSLADFKILP